MMTPMRGFALLPLTLLAVSVASTGAGPRHTRSPFALAARATDGWTLAYARDPVQSTTLTIDGELHLFFGTGTNFGPAPAGAPALPVDVISLGIPPGTTLTAELVDPAFESYENQLVAPVPRNAPESENVSRMVFQKDAAQYSQNKMFPEQPVHIESPYTLRGQRICTIRLAPMQYNPATRILRRLVRATVRIRIVAQGRGSVAMPLVGRPAEDPSFEDVFRSLLWNYEEARQWRQPIVAAKVSAGDSTRTWFETGRVYYRIPITADGWYGVTTGDLHAAGATLAGVDPSSFRILSRGKEVPVVLSPDTTIGFYGKRHYGDTTYYDNYTDTSVYWLTWGGVPGLRFSPSVQSPPGSGTPVRSVPATIHLEQNTSLYRGATEEEIINSDVVSGEAWVWEYYFPNSLITHQFTLDAIDTGTASPATLRVRLFGTTQSVPQIKSLARFWLNDPLKAGAGIGQVALAQRSGGVFTLPLSTTLLHNGVNALTLESEDTQTSPNQFYLDWFEITYQRSLRATADLLTFTVPASAVTGRIRIAVAGFSGDSIEVFDIAGNRQILGGIVGQDSAGYSIVFSDSLTAPRTYVVRAATARVPVPLITAKTFSDIRNIVRGADYILITHDKFLSQAAQLAAHRETTNNVRAQVINVQDIYDEFNFGIFSPEPIRSFLGYAYSHWTRPAPSIVLLFGGANADFHGWLGNNTKIDYLPPYGNPVSDNWFVCFDSVRSFLPSMIIGRLPVEESLQAAQVVSKVIQYDSYTLGEWNKRFLFITGGSDAGEQASFDALSGSVLSQYVVAPPIGGMPLRVSKTSTAPIDSSKRQELNALVTDGVGFINFLGHSAGSVWSLDIGNPAELGNTNGKLPFVSSVSCNVSSFADQTATNLSEQFVLADNRGAIAMWGSVSLGYAFPGIELTGDFFSTLIDDSVRALGALTTTARYKLWQASGSDFVTLGMVKLTPLLGDPLSRLAIPVLPDLAVGSGDINVTPAQSSVNDTAARIGLRIHNYGLVPADSVGITLSDLLNGQATQVLNNTKIAPTRVSDSISVPWFGTRQTGPHTLRAVLDPSGKIPEVSKANNSASIDQYVYGNLLYQIRPLENMVVAPGPQVLRVTNPIGVDSVLLQVIFEIDTVASFSSPFLTGSGPLITGPVSAEWTTPSLPDGRTCYWRVRTFNAGVTGPWEVFTFSTSGTAPALPLVRWRENSRGLFGSGTPVQTAITDTGVIIGKLTPLDLYVRSVGARGNQATNFFSVVRADGESTIGYPWLEGNGFICAVVNDVTGIPQIRSFDTPSSPAQADSMQKFISSAAAGNFVCVSVIYDGYTNVGTALKTALKGLGSTLIDSVRPGHAWSLIARTGGGSLPLEHWSSSGTTADSIRLTNYFPYRSGTFAGPLLPMPQRLGVFRWSPTIAIGTNDAKVAILGVRSGGTADTIRFIAKDNTTVDLSGLNQVTADPAYTGFKAAVLLATNDIRVTPVLRDWSADFEPPADLAISARSLSSPKLAPGGAGGNSVTATIYNIGYRKSDSARVILSVLQADKSLRPIAFSMLDSISPGGSRTLQIPFAAGGLGQQATLQIRVSPPPPVKDLIQDNNSAFIRVAVTGSEPLGAKMHVFADGVQLMEGDYVAARPKVLVHLYDLSGVGSVPPVVDLFVDNIPVTGSSPLAAARVETMPARVLDDPAFSPVLTNGSHELRIRVSQANASGSVDSVTQRLIVNVTDQYKILQMFNYPNPFGADTWFTFVVTGNTPPEELTVRIYSVAGRKIREIRSAPGSLQVGFNKVYWDGRDAQGDEVANGNYLYQVQITGGGKSLTATSKASRVR